MKRKKIGEIIFKYTSKLLKYFFILLLVLLIIYSLAYNINSLIWQKDYLKMGNVGILTIQDESMIPAIKKSQVMISYKVDIMDFKEKDIIAYEINGVLKIQRISDIKDENGKRTIITKGDNNAYSNIEEITKENTVGKVIVNIPIMGWFAKIVQNNYVCLFILVAIICSVVFKVKDKKKGKHS